MDKTAQGWAGIDRLQVYKGDTGSGTLIAEGKVGLDRADVGQAFGNAYWAKSGFEVQVDTAKLGVGTHSLTVYAGTPNRGWWTRSLQISVAAGYTYSVVSAPANDEGFFCLQRNPSCARDAWWIEWNDVGTGESVQYDFLGTGLITEQRFVEAIWLIWQWPEGKQFLRDASANGVRIISDPIASQTSFGSYQLATNILRMNSRYTEVATWMLADVLVHELTHAADDLKGFYARATYEDCITREQRAFRTETRYMGWVGARFGGLPSPSDMLGRRLSEEDLDLYADMYGTLSSGNVDAQVVRMYQKQCGPLPRVGAPSAVPSAPAAPAPPTAPVVTAPRPTATPVRVTETLPVRLSGQNTTDGTTRTFTLAGGDYALRWDINPGKPYGTYFLAALVGEDNSTFVTFASQENYTGRNFSGTNSVLRVPPGRYHLRISSPDAAWSLTLSR